MLTFTRSQIAKLYSTFANGGVPTDPSNLRITIYHGDDIVIPATTMIKIATGYYYYEFTVPDDWDEDFYSFVCTGRIAGVNFEEEETFRVIAQYTITGADLPTDTYCVLGDVEQELAGVEYDDIAGIDSYITELIYDADQEVDRICNRTFKEVTDTEYLNGNDSSKIIVPHRPIIEVTSCRLLIVPSTTWYTFQHIANVNTRMGNIQVATPATDDEFSACDLIVDCVNGILTIPERVAYVGQSAFPFWDYTFLGGEKNVKVTYKYGFTSANRPRDIRCLASKIVARQVLLYKGDQISGGSVGISIDGVPMNFQGVPYGGRIELLEKEIETITARWKKISLGML